MTRLLRSLRANLGVLEERNFRLLWLGQTGSTIGDGLSFVAIAFAVLEIGGSATEIGIVFAAYALPNVVFLLAGGVWADRLPRNRVMLTSDGVRAVVQAWLAVLLLTGSAEVWHVILVAAAHGAASAFFTPAATGLMPQVLRVDRLQEGNALMAISRSAAFVAGPALSGALIAVGGAGLVFAIDALTYVGSIITLALIRIGRSVEQAARAPFWTELRYGWREVRSRNWLLASLIVFAVSNMSMGSFMILGPVIFERELGGAAAWGAVMTAGSLGALLGGAVALRWKPGRPLVVGFAAMIVASSRSLVLVPPLPVTIIAVAALATLAAITVSNTLWETVLQQRIPPASLSRVSSYDWTVSLVFQPLAFAIVGPLAATIGEDQTLLLAAAISLAANLGALMIPSIRNMRRLETDAGATAEPEVKAGAA